MIDKINYYDDYNPTVTNKAYDVTKLSKQEISKIKDGWSINKPYDCNFVENLVRTWDCNEYFNGYINDFEITKSKNQQGQEFYYLNLTCSVLIPNGLYNFSYGVPANITPKSKLTRLLINLGFDVVGIEEFNPKLLVGIPILARLVENEGNCIEIVDLTKRTL